MESFDMATIVPQSQFLRTVSEVVILLSDTKLVSIASHSNSFLSIRIAIRCSGDTGFPLSSALLISWLNDLPDASGFDFVSVR